MLREMAEKRGLDLHKISREEYVEVRRKERENVANEDIDQLSKRFLHKSRKLLAKKENWFDRSLTDDETKGQMLEIVNWYQFFISAKLQRGLSGILDFNGNLDENVLFDSESDANGSI